MRILAIIGTCVVAIWVVAVVYFAVLLWNSRDQVDEYADIERIETAAGVDFVGGCCDDPKLAPFERYMRKRRHE